ncbi:hypothetical protein DRQ29_06940 [bacterium]|nr:MAG: hypothetical protein DRQ29_06940 [bacterium]
MHSNASRYFPLPSGERPRVRRQIKTHLKELEKLPTSQKIKQLLYNIKLKAKVNKIFKLGVCN